MMSGDALRESVLSRFFSQNLPSIKAREDTLSGEAAVLLFYFGLYDNYLPIPCISWQVLKFRWQALVSPCVSQ